jgi:hypothetical protein
MVNMHLLPLLSSLTLCPVASIAAAIVPRADCRTNLSCSFTQLAAMPMSTRLSYVKTMQSSFFGPLNATNQFAAIEGVIHFFINNNLGQPESWASYVDAGIVEGIQNGAANVLGLRQTDGKNPGTEPWARFFETMEGGGYVDRDVSASMLLVNVWC